MKISKVENTRSAIGKKKESKNISGVLYTYPNGKVTDLKQRIKERDKSIKNLYNIFVPIQVGRKPKEINDEKFAEDKEALKNSKANYEIKLRNYNMRERCNRELEKNRLNNIVSNLIFERNEYKKKSMKSFDIIISELPKQKQLATSDLAEEIITLALRKSLHSQKKGAITFLNCFGKEPSSEESLEIKSFLNLVERDFNKLDLSTEHSSGSNIIRSFDNQNMIYQPKNGTFTLPIPSQNNKKTTYKNDEKEGFEEFLSLFADLDENKRLHMLSMLRNIIDVYFSAPLEYEKKENEPMPKNLKLNENVWERHENAKANSEKFVEIPKDFEDSVKNKLRMDKIAENNYLQKINDNIRKKNMNCYRYTICVINNAADGVFFESKNINQFWVHHIQYAVERILKNFKAKDIFRLRLGYLTEKIWKDSLNYISIKYIALGKAVYHFGLDDLLKDEGNKMLGKLNDKIGNDGINSFDYEMIKANEMLQREIAVNVAFAANNMAINVADFEKVSKNSEMSDFLLWKKEYIYAYRLYNSESKTLNSILRFFGGKSNWRKLKSNNGDLESQLKKIYKSEDWECSFVYDLKSVVYAMRNDSFHFKTYKKDTSWNEELIGMMFENEAERINSLEKAAFYSNNLTMFYDQKDLEGVLDDLYGLPKTRASQVPSFNQVVKRNNYQNFLVKYGFEDIINQYEKEALDKENLELWESACFYLMKEIYYNIFLSSDNAIDYFRDAVNNNYDDAKKANEKNPQDKTYKDRFQANESFKKCIDSLKGSLSEICQYVMMEYNSQNTGQRKVRVAKREEFINRTIFKHYKLLLLQNMADAFGMFIVDKNNNLNFLQNPHVGQAVKQIEYEKFLPNWKSERYKKLINNVKEDAELQKWYVVGRFLNARMLNLMVGSMRSFLQYTNDIRKRAKASGNEIHIVDMETESVIEKAIPVIEVCIRLSSNVSAEFSDYFEDENDYAKFMNQYIAMTKDGSKVSFKNDMMDFCNQFGQNNLGIYTDAKKPKLNRNIVMAKLYAPDNILREIVPKITKADIEHFIELKKATINYRTVGNCKSKEEQEMVVNYQRAKNRVELRDLVEYAELINELQGQLINWVYLRERDLMYFQLGFHYRCLHNDTAKPEVYSVIKLENQEIHGAILSQIVGMYVYGVRVWYKVKKWKKQSGSTRDKIKKFVEYGNLITENGESLYNAGLEVFENIKEHDVITEFRNDIEHFRYYSRASQKSMLDYYSEMFDRFFTYDMKYQKNIINLLENILLRHMIILEPVLKTGVKHIGKNEKESARIAINSLIADNFTYKYGDKKMTIGAKSEDALKVFAKLLYYPQNAPENLVYQSERAKEVGGVKGNMVKRKEQYKKSKEGKKHSDKYSNLSIGNRMNFGNIDISSLPKG